MNYSKDYFDAVDINSSSFVFASAGSGKTKILVDRYIKSLFFGIEPSEILCITFTNAAVFEMETRISNILEKLYLNEDDFTRNYISEVFQIKCPTSEDITKAENLFFKFQDGFSGLKILTIHSFCQRLLQQFPIEANISPNFEMLEETETTKILQNIKDDVLRNLNEENLQKMSANFSIYTLEDFVNKIQQHIHQFFVLFENWKSLEDYRGYLEVLFNYEKDIEFNETQQSFIIANLNNEDLTNLYLTANGTIRKRIPFPTNELSKEVAFITYQNSQNQKKKRCIDKTCVFLEVVSKIINEYERIKNDNNSLDFFDVLYKTKYLLTKSYAKEFVLSKICSKIKAIMIDEAQDLSEIQWELIRLFSEDIYTDPSSGKTIFVVGDIKQSIYRFQGANYHLFSEFYQLCSEALKNLNKRFKTVYLSVNYRTLPPILALVDHVFQGEVSEFSMNNRNIRYKPHLPFRKDSGCNLEVIDIDDAENPAEYIADQIIQLKTENSLILTRSRNELSENIVSNLISAGVKIAPADRFNLKDNFLIMDIIALAKICINPQDDYALCCVLKSPHFFPAPLSNDDLFEICYNRIQPVLERLKTCQPDKFEYIANIIEHYKEDDLRGFFGYIANLAINLSPEDGHALCGFMDEVNKFFDKFSDNVPEFLKYFEETDIQIVNQNIANDCIRLSTIHGSKGLESDTVFLLDFNLTPDKAKTNFIFSSCKDFNKLLTKPLFFIKPSQKESFEELGKFVQNEYQEDEMELYRLLYVALTRARDNLYIFGKENDNAAFNLIKSKYLKMKNETHVV